MSAFDRTVHVLAQDDATEPQLSGLAQAGYVSAVYGDLQAAQRRMRANRQGSVWLVPFDETGEALLDWARQHAPQTHIIALVDQMQGEDVHRAYELGARYCASTDPADITRAAGFALDGLDLVGSRTRLRACAMPDESGEVRVLPAPQSA